MRPRILAAAAVAVSGLFVAALAGCASMSGGGSFTLSTTAVSGPPETGFDSGLTSVGRLNAVYGAAPGGPANHRSFPFTWKDLPAGTKALAVILDDPDARLLLKAAGRDAPSFLHWIAADIDPSLGGLPDNAAATSSIIQGTNGAGVVGYQAPTPPGDLPKEVTKKRVHIYRLKVYALSTPTGLKPGFTLDQLQAAIKDTTLGMAQLNVSYSNQ